MKRAAGARLSLQLILLVIGLTSVIVGLKAGEAREILAKAVVVCMECIGIG